MAPIEQLRTTLAALSLKAIDQRLEGLLEDAAKKEPSYADFLLEVVNTEADQRWQRYLRARLRLAHLPYLKTLAQFDFTFQPSIDERQIRELRTLRFVHEVPTSSCSATWGGQNASCRRSGRGGHSLRQRCLHMIWSPI